MKFLPLFLLAATLLAGCAIRPLKPGFGWIQKPDGSTVGIQQSENPKTDSTQKYERLPDGTERVETRVGSAQRDLGRETAAKLASLKGVVYLGAIVFIFGIASIFWAPLRVIIGSTTTSAAIAAGGLVLIVLPTMLVGHEVLIFSGVSGAVALWFVGHRYGKLRGEVETLKR